MRLVNQTTGRVLAPRATITRGFWGQFFGWMGRRRIATDEALGLPRCGAIHTFFVRVPLDAAYCDGAGQVLHVARDLRPFVIGPRVAGASMVWEAHTGVLAPYVTPGDVLAVAAAGPPSTPPPPVGEGAPGRG